MILFNKKNISTETPVSVERESSLFLKCFLVLSFFLLNQQLKSQVIEWQRTYHPEDNAKALDEDWFYDIKPSHSGTSGPQDGYIAVGYAGSGVVAISPPTALAAVEYEELHTSIRKKGTSHQLLTKLDLNGNIMWYVESSRSEFISKVIQTSDGNYVVAGTTTTGITKYNPTSTNTTGTTIASTPAKKRGYLAKYNTSSTLLWEYTYGLEDYASDSTNAVRSSMQLWDLHALLYECFDADALEMLDSMHYIGADKILLNTFIEEGEYTKAQDKIDALVIKNLQDDENINYLSLSQWWLDYLQNGGTMNHLEDSMKLALNDFKDTTIASSGLADVICIDANTPLLIHIPEKGNNYEERKSNQSALLASKINEVPNQLSVFPNPTCNILTIKYPFIIDKFVNLTLYNNTGEQVLSRRTENTGSMDLNMLDYQLKDGNYLVKIASSDAFYTASFIKFSY